MYQNLVIFTRFTNIIMGYISIGTSSRDLYIIVACTGIFDIFMKFMHNIVRFSGNKYHHGICWLGYYASIVYMIHRTAHVQYWYSP